MIRTIQHEQLDVRALERSRGVEAAEAAADDHHARTLAFLLH